MADDQAPPPPLPSALAVTRPLNLWSGTTGLHVGFDDAGPNGEPAHRVVLVRQLIDLIRATVKPEALLESLPEAQAGAYDKFFVLILDPNGAE